MSKRVPWGAFGALLVVLGFVFGGEQYYRTANKPHPATAALAKLAMSVAADMGGASQSAPAVVEKGLYVNVSVRVDSPAGASAVATAVNNLRGKGFVLAGDPAENPVTLCRDETVVEIAEFGPEGRSRGQGTVTVTWGHGSVTCPN